MDLLFNLVPLTTQLQRRSEKQYANGEGSRDEMGANQKETKTGS